MKSARPSPGNWGPNLSGGQISNAVPGAKFKQLKIKVFPKKTVEVRKGKRGRVTKSEAHNLHDRFVTYATSVPRFITDPDVRFTNNPGERKIHMAKVKQKVLGCFRTHHSAQALVYDLKQEIPFLSEV
ncbi:MAG: transposase [Roseovarius sp.]|nr:transposase [Roseovarius sp.]